ncbi:protein unc-93 homolog A-like [Saccostrea echinata]|uniref:protein unc-93 homolog A-like n=1 Tax=Saccostrea echinata TaxID=191078 RepID=UPI002A7FDC11|nr:protein unc-93 homolog A-like [Saccostrea echinata]
MMSRESEDDDQITDLEVSHAEMRAMLWGRQREKSVSDNSVSSKADDQVTSHRAERAASLSEEWKELKRLRSTEGQSENLNMRQHKTQSKLSVWKNFIALCTGLMFAFMSFLPLRNIQTSIFPEYYLGTISLGLIYGSFVIGCVVSPWLVQNARPKGLILFSLISHVFYVTSNLFPSVWTLLPMSVVFGFLQAPLWSVQELLIGSYGTSYSSITGIRIERSIHQFQSVFVVFCHSAQIFGNLIQSVTLRFDENYTHAKVSAYETHISTCNSSLCGDSIHTSYDETFGEKILRYFVEDFDRPDYLQILKLLYLWLACCSVILIGCCLRKPDIIINKRKTPFWDKICDVLSFFRTKTFLMLGLLMVFTGMQQAIVISDVTKMYGTDTLGMGMIGYLMMCYGTSQLAMLLVIEKLQKRLKSVFFVLQGFLVTQGLLLVLYIWEPHSDSVYSILGFMSLWGALDAVWQSQVQGILVSSAVRKEPAVICYRVCQGLGLCAVFFSSMVLTLLYKVCLIGSTLVLGVIGYLIMEVSNNPVTPIENRAFNV